MPKKIHFQEKSEPEKPEVVSRPVKIIYKYRYYCFACTGRVLYAPAPYKFSYHICPDCGKIHDGGNYSDDNWLPMSQDEMAKKNG